MFSFLTKWFVNILALLIVVHIVAGIQVDSWQTAILAALVLGLINATLRPLLIFLTLPFNVLSLGFLTLFINGLMFFLVSKIVDGFSVLNFWSAFLGALFFSIISFVLNLFFLPRKKIKMHRYDNVIDVEGKPED